jgi:citrate synthase
MAKTATLNYDGKSYELPVITGTENESAIDILQTASAERTSDL